VAAEVEEDVDTIAERIVQLGGEAEIAKKSRLPDYPLLAADGAKHVAALSAAIIAFTSQAREDIDAADEAGDAITADILTGIVRGLDKQVWFIEAHNSK
jgi:starvation-inducible DNA-binding protein